MKSDIGYCVIVGLACMISFQVFSRKLKKNRKIKKLQKYVCLILFHLIVFKNILVDLSIKVDCSFKTDFLQQKHMKYLRFKLDDAVKNGEMVEYWM